MYDTQSGITIGDALRVKEMYEVLGKKKSRRLYQNQIWKQFNPIK
jgi:hypothetical protein